MVRKCANPDCEHSYKDASEGALYVFDSKSRGQTYWLCPECSNSFDLVRDGSLEPILVLRRRNGGAQPKGPVAADGRAARLRKANSKAEVPRGPLASQSFFEWTLDWLEKWEEKRKRKANGPALVQARPPDKGPAAGGRASQLCRRSGLYEVIHHLHRSPHQAIILAGEVFPRCRQCRTRVSFEFLLSPEGAEGAEHIGYDQDFMQSVLRTSSGSTA